MGKKTIGKSVLKYQPQRPRAPTEKELTIDELVRLLEEEKARRMEEKIEKERQKIPEEHVPAELPHETKLGEAGWDKEDKEKTEEETAKSKELTRKTKKKAEFPLEKIEIEEK